MTRCHVTSAWAVPWELWDKINLFSPKLLRPGCVVIARRNKTEMVCKLKKENTNLISNGYQPDLKQVSLRGVGDVCK